MNLSEPTIRWLEPFAYKPGQPFRVMPIGTYKRGDRTLELTKQRLAQMAANYEANRPRWPIPLYFGHPTTEIPDPPKVGNVKRLFVQSDGLYAEPEWTEEGNRAVDEGKYQFVSPGVLWSLAPGSEYVDDKGEQHDNVIDHVALTNKPFFGKNVALFSATGVDMDEMHDALPGAAPSDPMAKMKVLIQQLWALANPKPAGPAMAADIVAADEFREYDTEARKKMSESGAARPDGSYPIADEQDLKNAIHAWGRGGATAADKAHIIKRARALGATKLLPADWGGAPEGESVMAEKVDEFTVKAEEFAALKAQAAKADALQAEVSKLTEQFVASEKLRLKGEMTAKVAETFLAVGKPEELVDKFIALQEKDKALCDYFWGVLAENDKRLRESSLFAQISSERSGGGPETLADAASKIVKEKFAGDMTHYGDAMILAGKANPALEQEYLSEGYQVRTRRARGEE